MGVMVPWSQIAEVAAREGADIIGLSGLITPSLEEMAHNAREMQRAGMTIPLLIGGATTSSVHTAVKIAPHYQGPVVWVPDASRSVSVCSSLLSTDQRQGYIDNLLATQQRAREQHAGKTGPQLITIEAARANGVAIDWSRDVPPQPEMLGVKVLRNYDLAEIARYIDWGPFFQTWDLAGPYPAILDDAVVGIEARKVLADAQAMLKKIIEGRWLTAHGTFGLFAAASVDQDDIAIYTDASRTKTHMVWHNLRQQNQKPTGQRNQCLADYIAPQGSGVADHIGAFAVGIHGSEQPLARFEKANDDYSAILLKALADRLAEAFAELLHVRVRREFWGYARDEALDITALVAESYQGIRPAPGYPACPDHTEKGSLFSCLPAAKIDMQLTESYAMWPASAVSGFYLAHPQARYFAVGKIARDQVVDYARRKGQAVSEAERWLAPVLGYEPT
jgi:5-methyltetrahydrofolate--homocysteine methyltransferase